MGSKALPDAAEAAVATLDAVQTDGFGDEATRLAVLAAARRLVARLETPSEQASNLAFVHPVVFAAVQTFIDLGIWEAWVAANGGGPKTTSELVGLANASVELGLLSMSSASVSLLSFFLFYLSRSWLERGGSATPFTNRRSEY